MSKVEPLAYADATPEQRAIAQEIIKEDKAHRYYASKVYKLYNAIAGKNEAVQTCASCLRNRAREVAKWYNEGVKAQPTTQVAEASVPPAAEPEASVPPAAPLPVEETIDVEEWTPPTDDDDEDMASHDDEGADVPEEGAHAEEPGEEELTGGYPLAVGTVRYPMGEGVIPLDFVPSEDPGDVVGAKGTVQWADGDKVKAGTYVTATGHTFAVQPGGKATIKEVDDLL